MKNSFIFIFILCLPVLILFQSCSSDDNTNPKVINKYPITSVDSLILKSLTEKKIVMIGDNYHGHGYYYNLVISYLNHWLDKAADNFSKRRYSTKIIFIYRACVIF